MLDPRLLTLFAAVARTQSISRAAAQLGLSKSVASRQLARLEASLGTRLLQRTTRKVRLTDVGEQVLAQVVCIEQVLESIHEIAGSYQQEVRGRLRVSCSAALGRLYVAPALPELAARYPKLVVSLQLEERFVDLVAENIDVALRFSHLADSSLIARKLADNPRVLVAAPKYLQKHGTPTRPQKLAGHQCVLFGNGDRAYDEWEFVGPDGPIHVRVRGQLQINDGLALVEAAVAGAGVLLIDRLVLGREIERGELVELLPNYQPQMGFPLYALYPERAWLPTKTTVFIDFMQRTLSQRAAM